MNRATVGLSGLYFFKDLNRQQGLAPKSYATAAATGVPNKVAAAIADAEDAGGETGPEGSDEGDETLVVEVDEGAKKDAPAVDKVVVDSE